MLVMAPSKSLQKFDLINTIQCLGVAYHFECEIKESLSYMHTHYEEWIGEFDGSDLHAIALCFLLLRQQGYYPSCAVVIETNLVSNKTEWVLDTGALWHFCTNKELFHKFEEFTNGECVYMEGFCDANWVTDNDEVSLTSGYVFTLGPDEKVVEGLLPRGIMVSWEDSTNNEAIYQEWNSIKHLPSASNYFFVRHGKDRS
ncbi:putative MAGUK p55 subfamily member 4-like [Capsicum annuum]|nr:putative MAGUK p55 subfamily member 4-like [Capsicum annuum]KAF3621751.1 putative MAGUK p55 subfamily member 4-like [Capsicum annuum]